MNVTIMPCFLFCHILQIQLNSRVFNGTMAYNHGSPDKPVFNAVPVIYFFLKKNPSYRFGQTKLV
jgi:hypothetical protein